MGGLGLTPMFAIAHLEDLIVMLSEAALEAVEALEAVVTSSQHLHQIEGLHLEVVEVPEGVVAVEPPTTVEVLETIEHLSVIPIILLDLSNVMVMEEKSHNNVMVSDTIWIPVI